jgi:choline dehydrogenase-like flavoprotein
MCHIAGTIGRLKISPAVWHGYDVSDEGVYCRRRFALRADVQRRLGLGNFVARLHHPRITDPAHRNAILSLLFLSRPLIPYEYAKRLHGDEQVDVRSWLRHLVNVLTGPLEAVDFAWHMLKDRKLAERKFPSIIIKSKANLYSLDFHAEQQPNRLSRVTLTDDPDPLGVPRIKVDWRYTRGDVDTAARSIALLAEDFKQSGVGTFDFDPASVEFEMTRYGAYGGHHIGTARMGTNPRTSVVDAQCRVHGIENLYIAGSATFPTSSQANPTLTIVALALRLAQRLRRVSRAAAAVPTAALI